MNQYNAIYTAYRPYARSVIYYSEGFRASGLARLAAELEPLATAFEKGNTSADTLKKLTDALVAARKAVMKEFDASTEQELLAFSARAFYKDVPKASCRIFTTASSSRIMAATIWTRPLRIMRPMCSTTPFCWTPTASMHL